MTKVKTLSEDVYKKIAAGEVVERPLSAVKELVENAIDAGADSIKVEVNEGGKQLIKIIDNGSGFHPDDIETAFKNHSTSKLTYLSDFDNLNTLGFRGEALPSILEVSKIELKTSDNNDGFGFHCIFEDGELIHREQIAFNKGTSVTVKDLFYNFPVRKKFLKTDRTELKQIISFLEPVSLVNYDIGFELIHNGKTVFMYKKAANLGERIYQVFGKEFLDSLQEVDFQTDAYKISGFISKLNTGVSMKKHQFFFVNGRPVREKTLIAALNNTFQNYLEKYKHPVGILLLTIPPHEVDVNIHPMKLEIKFVNSNGVYQLIKNSIASSMSGSVDNAYSPGVAGGVNDGFIPQYSMGASSGFNRPGGGYGSGGGSGSGGGQRYGGGDFGGYGSSGGSGGYGGRPSGGQDGGAQRPISDSTQAALFDGGLLNQEEFKLIGQYKNSYILVERNEELLIIDQHNAQERVNFDKLKKEYKEGSVHSISPLFPVIIELSPSEAAILDDEKLQLMEKMGFRLEPLSGNSFDVKSFPQVLGEKSIKDAVLEILHLQWDQVNFEDAVLAQVACKSAIKVNHKLFPDQMSTIVRNLFKTTNPYFCPHKRPIIIEFTLEKIEKMLRRK